MNVVPFRGRALDGDALTAFLAELGASGDVGAPFDAVDILAELSPANYARAIAELRTAYRGKGLDIRALARAVRLTQRMPPRARAHQEQDEGAAPVPEVCVNGDTPGAIADAVTTLLVASGNDAGVYQQDTHLTRIRQNGDGRTITEPLDPDRLRATVEDCIRCYTMTAGSETREPSRQDILLPLDLTRLILARRAWPFPTLAGISRVPVVRRDGTIYATPGYDTETRMVYAPDDGLDVPAIPEAPTQEDAHAAAMRLLDYYVDFPFTTPATDKANLLACMLTPLLRSVVSGPVPMLIVDATHNSSGKTLLAHLVTEMGTARRKEQVELQAWPNGDESEIQKLITTIAMEGDDVVFLDNLTGVLRSAMLEAALTASAWSGRILSLNKRAKMPLHPMWIATGNGVRVAGDLYRRVYWVHLDPLDAHPERRNNDTFRHPEVHAEVQEKLGAIVADELTIIRAWYAAGKPHAASAAVMGSYEEWSRLLADILSYAGVPGFLATLRDDQSGADEDSQQWEAFLLAWHNRYGDAPQRVQDVARYLLDNPLSDMVDALPPFLDKEYGKSGNGLRVALGSALRTRQRRRFGDSNVYAEQGGYDGHAKVWYWRVVAPGGAPGAPTTPPIPPTPPAQPDAEERPASDTQEHQETGWKGAQDTAPAWYEGEPWYTPSRPDSALSQALTWACHRNVNLAAVWCSSKKLQERWAQGQYIITGENGRGTTPAAFVRDLHRYYEQRRFIVLREIAKALDIEPPDRVVRSGQVQEGA